MAAEQPAVSQAALIASCIEIHECANGYIVMPSQNWYRNQGMLCDFGLFRVFQSFEALTLWLEEHFKHRSYKVPHDTK